MNSKARQRAMKAMLGSLLQADLTMSEIRELADDLIFGSFGKEFGEYLREMNMFLSEADRNRGDYPSSQSQSMQSTAQNVIERRRLSKKVVQQLMSLASPWIKSPQLPNSGTMKELIEKYFMVAPPNEVSKFIDILHGEPADAYLKGISRRDRAR